MSNYATYPCKVMRITQSYNGNTSHKPHTTGSPKDYPIDEGCTDTGRDWCYCPCDKMKLKRIYGVGTGGTNTIWLESTSKVELANGKKDYLTMLITHPNDDDLRGLKVGQVFKRGDKICREGVDGATGNHFHFSFGMGKMKGNGWTQNSNKKWVLTTTGGGAKPESLIYVDKSFTTVKNNAGLSFKAVPKATAKADTSTASKTVYSAGDYKVTKLTFLSRERKVSKRKRLRSGNMQWNGSPRLFMFSACASLGLVLTFTLMNTGSYSDIFKK